MAELHHRKPWHMPCCCFSFLCFHLRTCLEVLVLGFLSVWPIRPHLHLLVSSSLVVGPFSARDHCCWRHLSSGWSRSSSGSSSARSGFYYAILFVLQPQGSRAFHFEIMVLAPPVCTKLGWETWEELTAVEMRAHSISSSESMSQSEMYWSCF